MTLSAKHRRHLSHLHLADVPISEESAISTTTAMGVLQRNGICILQGVTQAWNWLHICIRIILYVFTC